MGPANYQGRFRTSRCHPVRIGFTNGRPLVVPQPVTRRIADNPSPTPSAAEQVFAIPELLGLILTYLPPGPLHHAMQVSKSFRDTIDPKAPHSLSGMRVALGLQFGRKIEDMTPSEHADLALLDEAATVATFLYDMSDQTLHRRFHWLLNVTLDPIDHRVVRESRRVSVPTLAIAPYHLVRIDRGDHAGRGNSHWILRRSGDESSNVLTLKFSLVAKGYENDAVKTKGIVRARTVYANDSRATWSGVKILTMPFDVRVCISVDFRNAMHARGHHIGHCQVPGCQVGDHGVQETSILLPAAQATLGNLATFLGGAEWHAIVNANLIRRQTIAVGASWRRDWYYLGGGALSPPPRIQREWGSWW